MKKNLAFFTSSARGLAHYVTHLYPEIKKYYNPFFITYSQREVDDLVKEKVDEIYPLIQNQSASSILSVMKFLTSNKIDMINLHVSDTVRKMHIQYFAMMSYAKYLGIPVCLTIHDVLTMESMYIDPAAIELLYSLGDSFIVGNEGEKEKLQFYFNVKKESIVVAPHGPYTMFDNHKYEPESAKKELGLDGKTVVLFFGQIRPNKGLKHLIKSLPLISEKNKDVILYISTDLHLSTPELNEYLKRIESTGTGANIRIVREYIPSSEIEKVFKAADVVALPYTQVSQSGVLNLAFAFKKPVIVSDVFSEASIINGKMGYAFSAGKYKDLAQSLLKVLSLKDKGKSMGEAGYKYSIEKSNWQQAAELTNHAFELAKENIKASR